MIQYELNSDLLEPEMIINYNLKSQIQNHNLIKILVAE